MALTKNEKRIKLAEMLVDSFDYAQYTGPMPGWDKDGRGFGYKLEFIGSKTGYVGCNHIIDLFRQLTKAKQ